MCQFYLITKNERDTEPSGSRNMELKRRRVGVSIACNACRRNKIRCDGQRPLCSSCDAKATKCSYRDDSEISQESQTLLLEVFRLLSAIPDQEVLGRVRSLKDEVDVSAILSRLRGDEAIEKHSDAPLAIPAMSEQFRLMELGPQYPNAYPVILSLDLDTLEGVAYQQLVQSRPNDAGSAHSLPLCDARLNKLEIGNWTHVPITNPVAARAISIYLETDHPLLGYFDPSLFVSDLVTSILFFIGLVSGLSSMNGHSCIKTKGRSPEIAGPCASPNINFVNSLLGAIGCRRRCQEATTARTTCKFYSEIPIVTHDSSFVFLTKIRSIWFHAAVLDLFRFSMSCPLKDSQLRTFTNPFSSPENVCIASARQLKQLVINYRLNFTSSSYTILWHTALTYLTNAILHYPKEDNWFFYFLLCVYGYERLQPCWRVTQVISTALLSMALRKGDISSPTARRVLRDVDHDRLSDIPGEVRATFMMDLDLATSDPVSATVEKMAETWTRICCSSSTRISLTEMVMLKKGRTDAIMFSAAAGRRNMSPDSTTESTKIKDRDVSDDEIQPTDSESTVQHSATSTTADQAKGEAKERHTEQAKE
ncbi:hypothetical protein MAC_09144 [Metarhizium acridum CQMa 102]|uniref:Zn(2)-C6 fungal-type domain-containing protein n=1 Tax=Metarhizium acridum (strain CQMa 102) TaxID=655827 RepID=E9EGZ6_METAQ|nr:uncharacterized protein MAC_09144 [Metarhizium acridum CQMa 102]EFY84822.1 hypothetical protein MAC_09144 [Metarhizium acridum CQMa 102]